MNPVCPKCKESLARSGYDNSKKCLVFICPNCQDFYYDTPDGLDELDNDNDNYKQVIK